MEGVGGFLGFAVWAYVLMACPPRMRPGFILGYNLENVKGVKMPRKRFTTEQIISKLREAEVELSRGKKIPQICKQLGVSEQTYYRWRKEYGGLRMDQAKKLRTLEKENARLKKLVADMALDNDILREAASGNF